MILLLLGVFIVAAIFHQFYWRRRLLPPGPTPFPLVGNFLTLIRYGAGYDALQMWKNKYGPVYTVWTGTQASVFITDFETLKETVIKDGDAYADRQVFHGLQDEFPDYDNGIVQVNGPRWREQRRFALHALRDFGMGKQRMQRLILEEAEAMMNLLAEDSKSRAALPIAKYLDRTVASVINTVIFGYRYDESTVHEFRELREIFDKQQAAFANPLMLLVIFMPWMKKIPAIGKKFTSVKKNVDATIDFFKQQVDKHRQTINYDSEDAEDLCELYLKEMEKRKNEENTTYTEKQLLFVCMDLWGAGLETTAATLTWAVAYLIRNPDIQKKMQAELDKVIGKGGRVVSIEDKARLPYTNAVVNEVQRTANILPLNLSRETTRDVVIRGMPVAKGTAVVPQISMLLYDPEVFPEPHVFRPERFLDEDLNVKKFEQFMPFSMGRRQCPGEALARMELFLFLSNLVYRFEISAEDPKNPPSLHRTLTTATRPPPYNCHLKQRIFT